VPARTITFRFRWNQHSSPVGKTRTLPAAGAVSLALAVLTCSNYPAGYFHAYAEAAKVGSQVRRAPG
jgi:alkaline phosphatase D